MTDLNGDSTSLSEAKDIFRAEFDRPGVLNEQKWYARVGGDSLDMVKLELEMGEYWVGLIPEAGGAYEESSYEKFDDALIAAVDLLKKQWAQHPSLGL